MDTQDFLLSDWPVRELDQRRCIGTKLSSGLLLFLQASQGVAATLGLSWTAMTL
jgi:hypothetical protein